MHTGGGIRGHEWLYMAVYELKRLLMDDRYSGFGWGIYSKPA